MPRMNPEQFRAYVRSQEQRSPNIRRERVRAEETRHGGTLKKESIKRKVGTDITVSEQLGKLAPEIEKKLHMSKQDRERFERGLKRGTWKGQIREKGPERSSPRDYPGRRPEMTRPQGRPQPSSPRAPMMRPAPRFRPGPR